MVQAAGVEPGAPCRSAARAGAARQAWGALLRGANSEGVMVQAAGVEPAPGGRFPL